MAVRVGIVGLGSPGRRHAESLQAAGGAQLTAVADLNPDLVAASVKAHGVRGYGHWAELLEGEPDLDAVILATPARVRLGPIQAIAERGIALFCEKPPALDLATARQACQAIARAGIINSVGLQFRWSPAASRMRELLAGRARLFARLVVAWPVLDWVKQGHASPALWHKEDCGGPMVEQGIHYQDVLRYVSQDEPVAVQAMAELGRTEAPGPRDSEDTTIVSVRHASGMLTSHVHNWSHRGRVMDLQIVGDDFELTWRMGDGHVLTGTLDPTSTLWGF